MCRAHKDEPKGALTAEWHEPWWSEEAVTSAGQGEKERETEEKEETRGSTQGLGERQRAREEKVVEIVSSFRRKAMLNDVPLAIKMKRDEHEAEAEKRRRGEDEGQKKESKEGSDDP